MIWLLRHGEAEDGEDDFARALTEKGQRQSELAGKALARLDAGIETCLTSPLVRARQTAELACRSLAIEPEEDDALSKGDLDLGALVANRGVTLVVGHEPDFTTAIAVLTGARSDLKKGGIALIEERELRLLLTPKAIAAIAAA